MEENEISDISKQTKQLFDYISIYVEAFDGKGSFEGVTVEVGGVNRDEVLVKKDGALICSYSSKDKYSAVFLREDIERQLRHKRTH
jgi:hypothetical protein